MMTIFSLYLPILLSLSLSFLLHTFKKHVHSFFLLLVTTFKNNINTISNNCHQPISSSPIVTHTNDSSPSQIMFVDEEIGGGADKLKCCTENLGFESIDEMRFDDQIDKIEDHDDIDKDNNYNNNRDDVDEDEDEEGCCEGRRDYWRELKKSFPPPLSSLNQKGQPSFALVPVRKNGTLQLNKVRIKRPEILYASREDGRLRLYLVPDHCNDVEEEEEEYVGEEQQEERELIEEDIEEEEQEQETIVESEEDEEIIRYEKEEDMVVGDRKIHNNIEGFRRCHQVVDQCHNHHHHHHHHHHHRHHHYHHYHHHHHNLHMYGVSIA